MDKKYIIYLLVLFLLVCCKNNRKETVLTPNAKDSLAFYFEVANNDSIPYSKRHACTTKILTKIALQQNDSMNRINYFKVANRYYNMRAFDDYRNITKIIVQKSEKAKDTIGLAKAYTYLGDYYNKKFISDSAYMYYFKAEKLYRKLNDDPKTSKAILDKCIVQLDQKDYIGSEKSAFDCLKVLRKTNDNNLTYSVYNVLGIIYNELDEVDKSIEFHNKALALIRGKKISESPFTESGTLNNIGLVYQDNKNNKKAIQYFEKALICPKLLEYKPIQYTSIIDNLGYSKLKIRDYKDLPNLFYKALKIADSLKTNSNIISCNLHLSEYYILKKDTSKAISFAVTAYNLAKKNNLSKDILSSLKQLSEVDFKKIHFYSKEYIKINDSLQLTERKIRNKFARIEFETEELSLEKDKLVERQNDIAYTSIAIILFFIIRYQIIRNKKLQVQQKANDEIYKLMLEQQYKFEEGKQIEKKRISQELHDGVMGRLSSIRLNLFVLSKKNDPETIAKCLAHINEIQDIEKEIRTIAYDLEKNIFSDHIGFTALIQNLFSAIQNHSHIIFTFHNDEGIHWETISNTIRIQIYRILQEALQNIDKYAQASNVVLSITKTAAAIAIEIKDDGIGFDTAKAKTGIGLKSMKARVQEIKGSINITSVPGQGTKINVTIPV